jgi:hypothetical protein
MNDVENIRPWVMETVKKMIDKPSAWPSEKETEITGTGYSACLRIEEAAYRGDDQWNLKAVAYLSRDAQIEMSMNLIRGTSTDIIKYLHDQLENDCTEPLLFFHSLCKRLDEKDYV